MSVSIQERKAVLNLFPYFNQKHSVVFDVGSNKGDWADILIDHISEMHLFEPNEIFLTYSNVRFIGRGETIVFHRKAIYKIIEANRNFWFFTNVNNGLSSLYDNPKWSQLPRQLMVIDTDTIDNVCEKRNIKNIDFLKIDIEGADFDAIMGSRRMLTEKRIKFIQVEDAGHIHLSGYTFENVIDYLKSFGYIPMQTEDTENVIFMQEGFTQDWNGEFKKNTQGMKFDFALEIGAFEGLTSRYICDNLLNPGGRMICIDPLTDEYLPGHKDNEMFVGQYDRFTRNTRGYPIELIRKQSIDAFAQLQDYRFDFIYIDGDHREESVYIDAVNAFNILKVGGHILFDDYEWREETKRGIDRFLNSVPMNKMTVVLKGYQVMIQKHENL